MLERVRLRPTLAGCSVFVWLLLGGGLSAADAMAASPEPAATQAPSQPAATPEFSGSTPMVTLSEKVHFDYNGVVLSPEGEKVMRQVARFLKDHPEFTHVSIEGHTDRSGDDAFNMRLSWVRAWAVRRVLARAGVQRSRLYPRGFGRTTPRNVGATPEQRALNRRVEIIGLKKKRR